MTLFNYVCDEKDEDTKIFKEILDKYFDGKNDNSIDTIKKLKEQEKNNLNKAKKRASNCSFFYDNG